MNRKLTKSRRIIAAASLAGLLTLFGAACSSSTSSSSPGTGGTGSNSSNPAASGSGGADTASASSVVTAAKQRMAAYTNAATLQWPKPTASFNPGTGKVAIITCGEAGVACAVTAQDAVPAAKAMGWTPSPVFDGKFSPSVQAGYIEQAIQQHYDAIVLMAIEPSSVQSAILDAIRANIPVACISCTSNVDGKVIDINSDGTTAGEAIADYALVASGGKVSGIAFEDPAYPANVTITLSELATFKKYCPACDVTGPVTTSTADITGPNPQILTSTLAAHPKGTLPYIFAPYDPAALQFIKTLQAEGRTEIKVSGNDAVPQTLAGMASCSCFAASTAAPFSYEAWTAMDEVARAKAGLKTWTATGLPFLLVTPDNIAQYSKQYLTPSFGFEGMFEKLWGK
jgi:ribose transport system substrate-binding protein